jgi:hypothetical protein
MSNIEGKNDEVGSIEAEDMKPLVFPMNSTTIGTKDHIKHALKEFYLKFNPEKVNTIDHILERYDGKEIELFSNLKEKYEITEYSMFDEIIRKEADKITAEKEMLFLMTPNADAEVVVPDTQLPISSKDSNATNQTKQSIPLTPTKDHSVQPPSLATLSTGMQDMSRLFTGWGIGTLDAAIKANTGASVNTSNTQSSQDKGNVNLSSVALGDSAWSARVSSLQVELQRALGEMNGLEAEARKATDQVDSSICLNYSCVFITMFHTVERCEERNF